MISDEIKRLHKKYEEVVDREIPAEDEISFVAGGFDILVCQNKEQKIAKLPDKSKKRYIHRVALLSPS